MARYFGSNRELARRNIGVVGRFEMIGIIPVKISGKNMLPEWPRAARSSQWQTRPGAAAHLCDDRRCADDPAHAPGLRVHAAVCRRGGAAAAGRSRTGVKPVRASPDGSFSPTILRSSNSCSAGPRAWTSSGIIRTPATGWHGHEARARFGAEPIVAQSSPRIVASSISTWPPSRAISAEISERCAKAMLTPSMAKSSIL